MFSRGEINNKQGPAAPLLFEARSGEDSLQDRREEAGKRRLAGDGGREERGSQMALSVVAIS